MEFWNAHMPKGMLLRSGADWHMDALGVHTFEAFLESQGLKKDDVCPIPVELYREYGLWFVERSGLRIAPFLVRELRRNEHEFEGMLDSGRHILAQNVLLTPGFRYFANVPESLASIIPRGRYAHTCDLVEFDFLTGKRCLIIGGRQSAFEWAALIGEKEAKEIHLAYRHATPRFEASDWTWVNPMMDLTMNVRGWYRRLPAHEKSEIDQRFWAEGRLKLEPWLAPRINKESIHLWPGCSVHACSDAGDGSITAHLSNGQAVTVDHVVLATGYRVDIARVPYLSQSSILSALQVNGGFPILDEEFQSSVPGLYMAGLTAAKYFGPFYGFVRGCPTAARIIVNRIVGRSQHP